MAPLSDPKLLAMKELEPSKDVKEIEQETEKEEEGDSIEIRRVFRPLQSKLNRQSEWLIKLRINHDGLREAAKKILH